MNLSFAGCGFLGIYHVGVASCFKEHAPDLSSSLSLNGEGHRNDGCVLRKQGKICGASAGAIAACCYLCNVCLGQCTSWVLRLAAKARARSLGPLHPSFHIIRMLREGLFDILPADSHVICSGRLFVSLTRVSDYKNVIVSQFDTKQDLIQALICSAFVPFYCGLLPPVYKGVRYFDGGLSDNLPILEDKTITISPFAGESDICPQDLSQNFLHITLANTSFQFTCNNVYRLSRALFPPHPEILSQMCKRGFDDALNFLILNNLVQCGRHISVQSTLKPIITDCHVHTETKPKLTPVNPGDPVVEVEDLPPDVIKALQEACDYANNRRLAILYKQPVFHVISFLLSPWLLPLDILYNFLIRFLQWMPYIPEDVRYVTCEMIDVGRELLTRIDKHRHHYSARFACQVAITEVNYSQPSLGSHLDAHSYCSEPIVRNLNIEFSVDLESGFSEYQKHVPTTTETLQKLESKLENLDIESLEIESHGRGQNLHLHVDGKDLGSDELLPCDAIFQTFEECLNASTQASSALSYHYDEDVDVELGQYRCDALPHRQFKVTDIYTLPYTSYDERSSDTISNRSAATLIHHDNLDDLDLELSWDDDFISYNDETLCSPGNFSPGLTQDQAESPIYELHFDQSNIDSNLTYDWSNVDSDSQTPSLSSESFVALNDSSSLYSFLSAEIPTSNERLDSI